MRVRASSRIRHAGGFSLDFDEGPMWIFGGAEVDGEGGAMHRSAVAALDFLLWRDPRDRFGVASMARAGDAFVFSCHQVAAFDHPCRVGRVPLARIGDRDGYRYLDLGGDFVEDPRRAIAIFEGSDNLSVAFAPTLDEWLFVQAPVLNDEIFARTAPSPWGPFDQTPVEVQRMFTAEPGTFGVRDVYQHPAYESHADNFIKYILSTGDAIDRNEAYRKFRGRDPEVVALLKNRGFL